MAIGTLLSVFRMTGCSTRMDDRVGTTRRISVNNTNNRTHYYNNNKSVRDSLTDGYYYNDDDYDNYSYRYNYDRYDNNNEIVYDDAYNKNLTDYRDRELANDSIAENSPSVANDIKDAGRRISNNINNLVDKTEK